MMENTEVKKAQLILVGGRPLPNMLTILYENEKPDIIVAITSKDAEKEIPFLQKAVGTLLRGKKHQIDIHLVDAFDVDQIKAACEDAIEQHKNADWLFNITGATTIMSIGAYEVAQEHQGKVKWWYLDTGSTRVITASDKNVNEALYSIDVEQYLTATYCSTDEKYEAIDKTLQEETWLPFALRLGTNTELVAHLKNITAKVQQIDQDRREQDRNTGIQKSRNEAKEPYKLTQLTSLSLSILEVAAKLSIVSDFSSSGNQCVFFLTPLQFQFLNGTWLEVYVYHAIKALVPPSNIEWGKYIFTRNRKRQELDVLVMYKGKLFLLECKTGKDTFDQKTFQALDSVANPIGGNFVTKIVVSSFSEENASNLEDMRMRAETSKINFFYKDSLPSIGKEFVEFASKSKGQ